MNDPNEAPRRFLALVVARLRGDLAAFQPLVDDLPTRRDTIQVLLAAVELYAAQAAAAGVSPDEMAAALIGDAHDGTK